MTENKVRKLLDAEVSKLAQPEDDEPTTTLFHYTDMAGLLGILRERRIWATHFQFLNDREELEAGRAAIEVTATQLLKKTKQNTWQQRFLEKFSDAAKKDTVSYWTEVDLFIASFTEKGDSLTQWQGYGGSGQSVAIGFSPEQFESDDTLVKCIYRKKKFQDLVASALQDIVRGGSRVLKYNHVQEPDLVAAAFNAACLNVSVLELGYKNAHFEHESEWRTMSPDADKAEFRVSSRGELIPYVQVPLVRGDELLQIDVVRVGPRCDERALRAVQMLLRNYRYTGVPVATSDVPLR